MEDKNDFRDRVYLYHISLGLAEGSVGPCFRWLGAGTGGAFKSKFMCIPFCVLVHSACVGDEGLLTHNREKNIKSIIDAVSYGAK